MKILYFDTETTGLNAKDNDIVSIGGIIEIDDIVKEEFYLEMQPFDYNTIYEEALKVNELTREQLKTFMQPQQAYHKIISIFSKYINKYNKKDKFTCVGHNVKFDIDFLSEFFKKNNDKYLGSYIDYHFLDTMVLLNTMIYKKAIDIEDCRLITAANKFNIEFNNRHNAMSDITVTKELFHKLINNINYN